MASLYLFRKLVPVKFAVVGEYDLNNGGYAEAFTKLDDNDK